MGAGRIASNHHLWPLLLIALITGCGGAGTTSVSGPTPARCGVSITNSPPEIPASGGSGSLVVNMERECTWSASVQDPWITLSATSGQGVATISYSVQPNPNGNRRLGRVVVSEQSIEVSQAAAPCQYSVSPSAADAPPAQGELSLALTATPGCQWTARSNAEWIGGPIPSSGVGSATVQVAIAANTAEARTGSVTLADTTFRVTQAAAETPAPTPIPTPPPPAPTPPSPNPVPTPAPNPTPPTCTYAVSPAQTSISSDAQDVTVTMNASALCAWTVTSDVGWITIADAGPGSGNGAFRIAVAANQGSARAGTVHAASETFTVQQAAPCTYSIKPTSYNADRGPETITINVTAGTGCTWSTKTDATWVTVDAGSTGSGNGIVRLVVQANSAAERSTVVTIAGERFTLHQEAACSYRLKPAEYHAGRRADDVDIDVITDAGCAWTASSSVKWVTVAEGAAGTGKGKVRLVIEANDGAPRSVVLTLAGQPFELRQDGRQ